MYRNLLLPRRRRGLTMLEMVAVAIIIAILATMVVQQVSGNILEARVRTAKAELRNLGNAVEIYAMQDANANFPATLDDLVTAGLIREVGTDPWGQAWKYCKPDRTTDTNGAVWSAGPNGKGTMQNCPGTNPQATANTDTAKYGLYYIIKVKP